MFGYYPNAINKESSRRRATIEYGFDRLNGLYASSTIAKNDPKICGGYFKKINQYKHFGMLSRSALYVSCC